MVWCALNNDKMLKGLWHYRDGKMISSFNKLKMHKHTKCLITKEENENYMHNFPPQWVTHAGLEWWVLSIADLTK